MRLCELKQEFNLADYDQVISGIIQVANDKISKQVKTSSDNVKQAAHKMWIKTVNNTKHLGLDQSVVSTILKHAKRVQKDHLEAAITLAVVFRIIMSGVSKSKVVPLIPDIMSQVVNKLK
jgi:formate dehydrogenase maturation protein FdhE